MMLGVRRAGVTVAANALKRAGLINYARGSVTVLDRPGMERRTCECYGVTKREFDQLLGLVPTSVSRSSQTPSTSSLLKPLRSF